MNTNLNSTNNPQTRHIKLRNLASGDQCADSLNSRADSRCLAALIDPQQSERSQPRSATIIKRQAIDFINQYYASIKRLDSVAHKTRLESIKEQLKATGTYYINETELIFGAKLAWRNASRCVGRIQWSKLQVFDARFTTSADEMFEAICNHIKYATNKGQLRSAITVFPPRLKSSINDWRIWNNQIIGYAGYKDVESGEIIGDPVNVEMTQVCQRLGWQGKGSRFDILPLVLSAAGGPPKLYTLPEDLVLRVKLKHPKYDWFEKLGLEWYALPAVSNMMLDVGGLQFTAAPFNGWYMVTEIGTRDLGDAHRYNALEAVAKQMGLNTKTNASLWKDYATVELNIAVLDSFRAAGVTIVDHHTAVETFMTHFSNETRLRGGCPADWVWLVPPTCGSATAIFHQEVANYHLLPNYEYMEPMWRTFDWSAFEESQRRALLRKQAARNSSNHTNNNQATTPTTGALLSATRISGSTREPLDEDSYESGSVAAASPLSLSPARSFNSNATCELTPRKLRFKEIARAVKFTSKLFGKALSRRIKATILYATETGKSERFANKLAQTFSQAFNVHLMSMSDYDMTCLEHEALLLVVTSTFGNGDPPENGEPFAKHLAAVKLTGDTSPDIESINSVQSNPFFQMLSQSEQMNDGNDDDDDDDDDQEEEEDDDDDFEDDDDDDDDYNNFNKDNNYLNSESNNNNNNNKLTSSKKEVKDRNKDRKKKKKRQTAKLAATTKSASASHRQSNAEHAVVRPLSNVRFGVFALGSTAYPHYCAFGRYVDQTLTELGAEQILKCTCGDELCGQEKAFNEWSSLVFKTACDVFCITDSVNKIEDRQEAVWSPRDVKFVPVELIDEHQPKCSQQANNQMLFGAKHRAFSERSTSGDAQNEFDFVADLLNSTNIQNTISNNFDFQHLNIQQQQSQVTYHNNKQTITNINNNSNNNTITTTTANNQQQQSTSNNLHINKIINRKQTIIHNLANMTNKKIISFKAKTRQDLHAYLPNSDNLQTLNIDLEADRNLICEPGDHVAIYPTNKSEMVSKIVNRMSEAVLKLSSSSSSSDQLNNKFDFDQVYSILVKRESMDLTPSSNPTTATTNTTNSNTNINSASNTSTAAASVNATNAASINGNKQQVANNQTNEDNWIQYDRTPVTTIREALLRYLDITSAPSQDFLSMLSRQCTDMDEKKRLRQLARNFTDYEEWKLKTAPNLLAVLEEFKAIQFEPAFITQLPVIKPRFYSISGLNVSITVGVVRYKTNSGQQREGLCSNYLLNVPLNSLMFGYIRSAPAFHMPQDKRIPLILIGAGTGIAPFRSFWQQRMADIERTKTALRNNLINEGPVLAASFGRIELYFGCRNSNYVLYRNELDLVYERQVLSGIHIGFSRPLDCDLIDNSNNSNISNGNGINNNNYNNTSYTLNHQTSLTQNSNISVQDKHSQQFNSKISSIKQEKRKVYVQDKLLENKNDIHNLITQNEAHIYVCGDVAMADGVYKTLVSITSQQCMLVLRSTNRYHEDIFGAKNA